MKTILMTMRVTEALNYKEERNSIAYEYVEYFEKLGYLVILVPNNTKYLEFYLKLDIDLIVLSGGNNVNPKLYSNNDLLNDVYTQRDTLEYKLLKKAIKNNIKVLGICRGFHLINVFYNGILSHGIKNHVNIKHRLKSNKKYLDNKSTNSFHNQAIKKNNLARKLDIVAISKDKVVEAFISKDKNILGIQWHPERQNKKFDKKLIKQFLKGKI